MKPESYDWWRDYYSIIGVPPDASQSEINRAFRTLARSTHPDANRSDPDAAAHFALLAEAKAVLGDPETRAAYDRARAAQRRRSRRESRPAAPEPSWSHPDVVRVESPLKPTPRPTGATVRAGPVRWIRTGEER